MTLRQSSGSPRGIRGVRISTDNGDAFISRELDRREGFWRAERSRTMHKARMLGAAALFLVLFVTLGFVWWLAAMR